MSSQKGPQISSDEIVCDGSIQSNFIVALNGPTQNANSFYDLKQSMNFPSFGSLAKIYIEFKSEKAIPQNEYFISSIETILFYV